MIWADHFCHKSFEEQSTPYSQITNSNCFFSVLPSFIVCTFLWTKWNFFNKQELFHCFHFHSSVFSSYQQIISYSTVYLISSFPSTKLKNVEFFPVLVFELMVAFTFLGFLSLFLLFLFCFFSLGLCTFTVTQTFKRLL